MNVELSRTKYLCIGKSRYRGYYLIANGLILITLNREQKNKNAIFPSSFIPSSFPIVILFIISFQKKYEDYIIN